ncbi:MAG: T9SS type A sorting domain-containing protein, partial [candidate division WOR-3 bacterium]
AMKGGDKPNYFARYSIADGNWAEVAQLPEVDSFWAGTAKKGKKFYVKDGGALVVAGNAIYAIKGGGVPYLYWYGINQNSWLLVDTVPKVDNNKKSVPKTGASMAYLGGAIYLLKGNNTPEFWRYGIGGGEVARVLPVTTPSVATERTESKALFSLDVTPNPLTKLATVRYNVPQTGRVSLKLYDASGRVVSTLYEGTLEAGTYTMTVDATRLARGVYFLKYEQGTEKAEVKLLVR